MKSNYKKLGEYIEAVTDRNTNNDLGESDVRGVSNSKKIIETRANNLDRDFSSFYIVEPGAFIYNSRTSRMGEKVGLGFNDTGNTFITSFNNSVFRVNTELLLPMYLFMWFNRPEFDRYVRFHSWGSSTEIFSWNDMCNVIIPVPAISKQKEIVAEYNTIVNRIKLNELLCQKLEETAHIYYKEWFVNKIDLENLPEGWRLSKIGNEVETLGGGTPSTEVDEYWIDGEILWYSPTDITNNDSVFIFESANKITKMGLNKSSAKLFPANSLMMTSRATVGKIAINTTEATTNQGFITMIPTIKMNVYYLYCWAKSQVEEIVKLASGSTFLEISKSDFRNLTVIVPDDQLITDFKKIVSPIFELIKLKNKENQKLTELKDLLLSKLATIEN